MIILYPFIYIHQMSIQDSPGKEGKSGYWAGKSHPIAPTFLKNTGIPNQPTREVINIHVPKI